MVKLISLNIWGGNIHGPLLEFITKHKDTDIFCFQEILNGTDSSTTKKIIQNAPNATGTIYSQIQGILPMHSGYFAPAQDQSGLGIFIKKGINVKNHGDIFVFRKKDAMENNDPATVGKNLQYLEFAKDQKPVIIVNFHGLWIRKGKEDSNDRISQSEKIKAFLDSKLGAKILVGDFNLKPNTKSLAILESKMRNLVKEYKVASTRSSKFYDWYKFGDTFADYILVSNDLEILDFKVLQDQVSDHLPLYLEF